MKFRKKPVVIEAEQFTSERALECLIEHKPFAFGLQVSGNFHPGDKKLYSAVIHIQTLEGKMRCEVDDWVIRGVKQELYPCKPDIFDATYEPV